MESVSGQCRLLSGYYEVVEETDTGEKYEYGVDSI